MLTAGHTARETSARGLGLLLGIAADRALADPARLHPVAGFGHAAGWLEGHLYADSHARGAAYTAAAVGSAVVAGVALRRIGGGRLAVPLVAAATWTVLGGESLSRAGLAVAQALEAGDLTAARARLSHLCGRDPSGLDRGELARATIESLAENTSDAVVAPMWWGAVAGLPGLLGYRAVNTLDAMVGYRSERYLRFGWASARLDDAANWLPARLTGVLTVLAAPLVGGSPASAWRVLRRDGGRHPSPNAGRCEASAAGALGVRLGGTNTYGGAVESRPVLGDGRQAEPADIRRAVRLARVVGAAGAAVSALVAVGLGRLARR